MSKIANTLFGFAAGTAVGVGLGILFAQDKGENTRKKIKDSVRDTVDELKEQLESLTKSLRNKSSEIKGTLEERVDNLLSDTDYNSEDLIDLLEKKLASMKKAAKKQLIKQ
ncbi:YtxH domain-containing protein [Hoylesella saccharolytica]|uniref:YtxH domain-containing protein n=1 Tax=Hoylesella saccharolytica TaxID=633701 RepID=UPI0028D0A661|nr:YtxH domain-containing protein [Hoylesella saccharolytica]